MSDPAARLRTRATELDALLARLGADDEALRADRSAATADDEHDPEGSTLAGEWQRLEALRRSVTEERADVDTALARVDAGVYGICVMCGSMIAPARLDARPMATTCIACAV